MKLRRGVLAAVLLALTACAPQEPVKPGFLGGSVVAEAAFNSGEDASDGAAKESIAAADVTRFKGSPGFASVTAYDAPKATLTAPGKSGKGQPLKQALLASGPCDGLREGWSFDRNGDARRQTCITGVRDGRFVRVVWSVACANCG